MYGAVYGICFGLTVVNIMVLLWLGVRVDEYEAAHHEAEVFIPGMKEWVGYLMKAMLIALVVSFAAPIVLVFYVFVTGCIIMTAFRKEN